MTSENFLSQPHLQFRSFFHEFRVKNISVCRTYFIYICKYYDRFTPDEEALDDQEESGWKYIHGDVFRYPRFKALFAAAHGIGSQLFTL